jgi:type II secretory pathway pseudopilin PulG
MSARRRRSGMTLVEVIVAMFILTGVILVLGGFSAGFARANAQAHLVISANEIAAARLDEARTQPSYSALEALADSSDIASDNTVFTRVTTVRRVGSNTPQSVEDYRLVTVRVTHPAMRRVVSKTTAITAF